MNQKQSYRLSKILIEKSLAGFKVLKAPSVFVFDEIDSTNQWMLDNIPRNLDDSFMCVSESQRLGRGRAGRQWSSPSDSSIYMSFSCAVGKSYRGVSAISLVVGLALVRVLKKKGVDGVSIKWPNDVLVDGKKLAGVLIESKSIEGNLVLVIGIGINVQMPVNFKLESGIGWGDLAQKGVLLSDRNELIAMLYKECVEMIEEFLSKGFSIFQQEWLSCDEYARKVVKIIDQGKIICSGVDVGIDEEGCLLVESGENIKHIHAGDVSLRIKNDED